MSEDPKLFDAGDYNLYRYCHNDPEDLTDPMGLWPVPPAGEAPPPPPPPPPPPGTPLSVIGFSPRDGDVGRANNYFARQQALQMALTGQSQGRGGVQYRYTAYEGREGHRTNYKEGGADFRWQGNEYYPNSKTLKPLKEGWGNREVEIPSKRTGNIGRVVSSEGVVPLSSKAIMTDSVRPLAIDPGGTVHGTATFREQLYERIGNAWSFVPGMTTQLTHTYDRNAAGVWHVDSQISTP